MAQGIIWYYSVNWMITLRLIYFDSLKILLTYGKVVTAVPVLSTVFAKVTFAGCRNG